MKTTIDSAGRLVIPKAIREKAGLKPGIPLDIRLRDGHVEIEPEPVTYRLEKRGRFLVAVPDRPVPPITVEEVEAVLDEIRMERGMIDSDQE